MRKRYHSDLVFAEMDGELFTSAQKFWEKRIRLGKGILSSVGHWGLTEEENINMYKAKEENLECVIKKLNMPIHQMRVLDAGCGIGYFTKFYSDYGAKTLVAIDSSPSAIMYTKEITPDVLCICSKINEFKCLDNTFDIVHCFDVLYHIVDDNEWVESIENIVRILDKNGYLIITEVLPKKTIYNPEKTCHVKCRSLSIYKKEFITKHKLKVLMQIKMSYGYSHFSIIVLQKVC